MDSFYNEKKEECTMIRNTSLTFFKWLVSKVVQPLLYCYKSTFIHKQVNSNSTEAFDM